jgi:hypothetical protein
LFGENSDATIIGRPVTLRMVRPYCATSVGRFGCACARRFCTFT